MADKSVNKYIGAPSHFSGKSVNVYDSYANALAHGSSGLKTVKAFNKLDSTAGAAVTQVAKTTGFKVDENGFVQFNVDNGAAVWLMIAGSFVPVYVGTGEMF